jgi:ribonuclease P protein component
MGGNTVSSITSLKKNYEFKRLYTRGESLVSPFLAIYVRRNRLGYNRLGVTVGSKIGKAVRRNHVRRRIKEAYRIHQQEMTTGYDIVIVARVRAAAAPYKQLESSLLHLMDKLGI